MIHKSNLVSNLRAMPGSLRLLTLWALVVGVSACAQAFLPGSLKTWVNGVETPNLTLQDYWRQGFGPGCLGMGLFLLWFASGILLRRTRIPQIAAVIVWGLALFALGSEEETKLGIVTAFGFAAGVTWFFYRNKAVRAYFSRHAPVTAVSPIPSAPE